jgi:Holliday junction resolvasome RuvABC endonuclease subunit
MTHFQSKYRRILAIAPSTRGFGFALLEGLDTLADWGVKSVVGSKNAGSVAKVKELVSHYQPDVLALEDCSSKDSRRSPRIRRLGRSLVALARNQKIKLALFPQKQIRQTFALCGAGTKHARAEFLAQKFADEIGFRLPPKRKPWMSEDYRMDIFDAVGLAVMPRLSMTDRRIRDCN